MERRNTCAFFVTLRFQKHNRSSNNRSYFRSFFRSGFPFFLVLFFSVVLFFLNHPELHCYYMKFSFRSLFAAGSASALSSVLAFLLLAPSYFDIIRKN